MKRLHVHVAVDDLQKSIGFYCALDYGDGTGERGARIAHEKSCCASEPSQGPTTASACCK